MREDSEERIIARIRDSLSSELRALIVDERLVSIEVVDRVLSSLNAFTLIAKKKTGYINVYYVDDSKLRKMCLYEMCSTRGGFDREKCVNECIDNAQRKFLEHIISSLKS
ncbi:MAG: hypothetical protein P3X22_006405 [Thermoprotei archaeon]|nr:hypothetical protein [Thermoprotei archaeon]